ncbi:hypothetical protein [Brazilian marseillevirus]|uniref:hypothetical protein n=1 Tax=Brazilian marseillevirus TaxID=1813599 RepID=UPI0007854DB5|nr:hypothetical protein A3303_gp352 [Brazilian marseillevirus]AMQ10860.1 hypothetical protein [Brazilian marseillevirus]
MLEKLPIDNLLQILGYLELEDLAVVDRSHKALRFACAQIYLRDKKHQTLSLFLKSVNPTLRWGERWSSPVHIEALRRAGNVGRRRKNPFKVPTNKRVKAERLEKREKAEKLLKETLDSQPENRKKLLNQLWKMKNGEVPETPNVNITESFCLLKESLDKESLEFYDSVSFAVDRLLEKHGFYDYESDDEEDEVSDDDGGEFSEDESE